MKRMIPFLLVLLCTYVSTAQESQLPYRSIPTPDLEYNPGNVLARFIDGLGFRYYWATEGLSINDLPFRPSDKARDIRQTLEHICDMSLLILNSALNKPNTGNADKSGLTLYQLRELTLNNLKMASESFANKSAQEISQLKVIFGADENRTDYDFWYMINGPVADAMYHTGQVVSFRRAAGNPINPNVNVFLGVAND